MDEAINLYDNGKTACTVDDKATAARIGGHTWNILNNSKEHEVYLLHARNDDHYISEEGRATSLWFQQRRRVLLPDGTVRNALGSEHVTTALQCPPTAGKDALHLSLRESKQRCQASAPLSYRQYTARRDEATLRTPVARPGSLDRTLRWQDRLMDVPERPPARLLDKGLWTPRRGPLRAEPTTPSHQSAAATPRGSSGSTPVAAAATAVVASPAAKHSRSRMQDWCCREISDWRNADNKLKRNDPYFALPVMRQGTSGVKYNIITHQRESSLY